MVLKKNKGSRNIITKSPVGLQNFHFLGRRPLHRCTRLPAYPAKKIVLFRHRRHRGGGGATGRPAIGAPCSWQGASKTFFGRLFAGGGGGRSKALPPPSYPHCPALR